MREEIKGPASRATKLSAHTPGPWQWVDPDSDTVWEGGCLRYASLRTVEEFGVNETKVIDGKSYTSFALPKFITEAENIGGDEVDEANARLIAAAPELLDALVAAMKFIDSHVADPDITQEMEDAYHRLSSLGPRAIIAKATGSAS